MKKNNNLHLLWRSGFGPNLSDIGDINKLTAKQLWQRIKDNASTALPEIAPSNSFVRDNYSKTTANELSKVEKDEWGRKIRQQSNKDFREFNHQWIQLMVHSHNQLAEKMSFFWHHHFAIRQNNSLLQQDAFRLIRKHALGNFGDLLREVSKSAAMVLSLNNQQNRKRSPNENFAREIMELFSMGMGHYTENDIKEVARAFTGWGVDKEGQFTFNRKSHDGGIKSFFGRSGNFDGDDIIDIILEQPQTSIFITSKIYCYFVNERPDAVRIELLAQSFRKDYNILQLLDHIFSSDWFYEPQHMANRVKTPIELLVGLQRLSPISAIEEQLQYRTQRLLGQVLFNPPSIAGWPSGKSWLDSSSLMVRLQLPQIIAGTATVNLKAKIDDDRNMGLSNPDDVIRLYERGRIVPNPDWDNWLSDNSEANITTSIVLPTVSQQTLLLLQEETRGNKNDYTHSLMNLPEYQLC
ncbi:MAG: DUF1800 domain-containing protein [Sphingobacterium sp.]|jgi:uncharacterized protein (DUF1800 family)|nr:DUF1800 domain-containing protein [Sphingobacterium sp.]